MSALIERSAMVECSGIVKRIDAIIHTKVMLREFIKCSKTKLLVMKLLKVSVFSFTK